MAARCAFLADKKATGFFIGRNSASTFPTGKASILFVLTDPPFGSLVTTNMLGRGDPDTPIRRNQNIKEKIIRKSKMFSFRLSEADYQQIHAKAKRANLTMTAFITTAALGKKIVIVEGFDKSISELKAIGRNLNQLTMLCNNGQDASTGVR